jgi:hypothetical protein
MRAAVDPRAHDPSEFGLMRPPKDVSLDTADRSFGGEVQASSPICRLPILAVTNFQRQLQS